MTNKFLILAPKYSSYENASKAYKATLKNTLNTWVQWVKDLGVIPSMLAEDMLMVEFFAEDNDVSKRHVIDAGDVRFLLKNVGGYPKESYAEIECKYRPEEALQRVREKYPYPSISQVGGDTTTYFNKRLNILDKRIKYSTEDVIQAEKNIIQILDGNNYFKPYTPQMGDGKIIVSVNVKLGIVLYYYGGIPVGEDIIKQVVEV